MVSSPLWITPTKTHLEHRDFAVEEFLEMLRFEQRDKVAEVTGYNDQYLRRLLRAGRLDAIKIGQVWLVNLESLEAYLTSKVSSSDRRCGSY